MKAPFWQFRCEETEGDEPKKPTIAQALIYSSIGDPWDPDSTMAKRFADDLAALPESITRLNVRINSPGGDVFTAQAIHSQIAEFPKETIVYNDGLVASAATIVAMAGDKFIARQNSNFMIHMPRGFAAGTTATMRKIIEALDNITEPIITLYAEKTGRPRDEMRALMEAETWMTPDKAKELGFVDEVRGKLNAAASLVGPKRVIVNGCEFDLAPYEFKNLPEFPHAANYSEEPPTNPSPPEITTVIVQLPERQKTMSTQPPAQAPTTAATASGPAPATQPSEFERGRIAERERLAALAQLDHPACTALIAAARADGRTAEQIAVEVIALMRNYSNAQDRRQDASVLNTIPVGETPIGNNGEQVEGQKRFGDTVVATLKSMHRQPRRLHGTT